MSKLSTRMSAAVALAAGASVLATGTSFAAASMHTEHSGKSTTAYDHGEHEGKVSPKADTDPGDSEGKDGKPGGPKGDDHGGKPGDGTGEPGDDNPGPLPPLPGDGADNPGDDSEGIFGFCPPLKDINLSWQGLHLNYPLVGGVVEGMSDLKIDPLCLNMDYPSPMSPGHQLPPTALPQQPQPQVPQKPAPGDDQPDFPAPDLTSLMPPAPTAPASRAGNSAQNPLSGLIPGATSSPGGAGTGNGPAKPGGSLLGGLL